MTIRISSGQPCSHRPCVLVFLLSGAVYVLDDIIQPTLTSIKSTVDDIILLTQLTYQYSYEILVPPITCAGKTLTQIILNAPNYLLNLLLESVNTVYQYTERSLKFISEATFCFIDILKAILDGIYMVFEDPINGIRNILRQIHHGCSFLYSRIHGYYQHNQKNPVLFSDVVKTMKKIIRIKSTHFAQYIYNHLEPLWVFYKVHVLPILKIIASKIELGWKLVYNFISDSYVKIQPVISQMIQLFVKYLVSFYSFCQSYLLQAFEKLKVLVSLMNQSIYEYLVSFFNFSRALTVIMFESIKTFIMQTVPKYSVLIFNSTKSLTISMWDYIKIFFTQFIPNYSVLIYNFTKTFAILVREYIKIFFTQNIPKYSISVFEMSQSVAFSLNESLKTFTSMCSHNFVLFVDSVVSSSKFFHEKIVNLVWMIYKFILNHFHQNQKQPRLFSQVFKQMIKMK